MYIEVNTHFSDFQVTMLRVSENKSLFNSLL